LLVVVAQALVTTTMDMALAAAVLVDSGRLLGFL
jgi:hypothetical protein